MKHEKCYLCLRTRVTLVPGPYNTSGGGRSGIEDERADFLFLLYRMFAEYLAVRLRLTNEELIELKRKHGVKT